jgi:uncharacterized protein (UPF0210 family)
MKIRSITYFTNPGWPLDSRVLDLAAEFTAVARPSFEEGGFDVQTTRLATPPFPTYLPDCKAGRVLNFAQELEDTVSQIGFEYLSIGPAIPDMPESYAAIPGVIAGTTNTFATGVMASPQIGISLQAVRACADIICQLSPQDPTGFANLYFAALANVPPGTPFFPAAYHDGGSPAFAIATEAADLVVAAFSQTSSLSESRRILTELLESSAGKICAIANSIIAEISGLTSLRFGGIDFSPAPFPEIDLSLGTGMEHLGVPKVGKLGSLTAAAIIADTIDKAEFPHTGFSGMILPVLEDATLSARAAEGILTIKDLLLYSTVCGTGLDTVPLPGDLTPDQVVGVLLDVSALALRLDKPLTARLMPIPGAKAGDPTHFDFPFFANSRVMSLDSSPLEGGLSGNENPSINPHMTDTR